MISSYGWVGSSSLAGLCAGGISNFLQTRSIFKKPEKPVGYSRYASSESGIVHRINAIREHLIYSGITTAFNALALIPVTTFVFWNIVAGGTKSLVNRTASEVYSHILNPLIPTLSSLLATRAITGILETKFLKNTQLDISNPSCHPLDRAR